MKGKTVYFSLPVHCIELCPCKTCRIQASLFPTLPEVEVGGASDIYSTMLRTTVFLKQYIFGHSHNKSVGFGASPTAEESLNSQPKI